MKFAIQLITILCFWGVGEAIGILIDNKIPGSLIGMILLFIALNRKLIKEEWVEGAAKIIIKYMVLFFLPAAVAVMAIWQLIEQHILAILLTILLSTILIIVTVSYFQERHTKQ